MSDEMIENKAGMESWRREVGIRIDSPDITNDDFCLFRDALAGHRGDDQKRLAESILEFGTTLLRKNNDYGSSVWKRPILTPDMSSGSAILVRMSDKLERIINLSKKKEAEIKQETWDDTLKDFASYVILYYANPEKACSPMEEATGLSPVK